MKIMKKDGAAIAKERSPRCHKMLLMGRELRSLPKSNDSKESKELRKRCGGETGWRTAAL